MDQTVTSGAPGDGAMMDTTDWQARAGHIREVLAGSPATAVAAALGTFLFADDAGRTWTYNGALWMSWDGTQWSEGTVPANLRLQPFITEPEEATKAAAAESPTMAAGTSTEEKPKPVEVAAAVESTEVVAAPVVELPAMADSYPMAELSMVTETKPSEDKTGEKADKKDAEKAAEEPAAKPTELAADKVEAGSMSAADLSAPTMAAAPAATTATPSAAPSAFKATHAVPPAGMGAWTRPDPTVRPEYQLAARTELVVTEMLSSGWAHVAGSNGWTGWVDGRQLVSLQPSTAPAAAPAMSQPAPMQQPATAWQPSQPAPQPATPWQPAQPTPTQWQPAQPAPQPTPQWQPAQPAPQPAQPAQPSQPMQQPAQPMPSPQAAPAIPAQPAQAAFRPTHAVPPMGMPAWAQPNPQLPPTTQLQGGLQVMVAEGTQSGWARIVASNGWTAWVDGRMLVPMGQGPYPR